MLSIPAGPTPRGPVGQGEDQSSPPADMAIETTHKASESLSDVIKVMWVDRAGHQGAGGELGGPADPAEGNVLGWVEGWGWFSP